MKASYYTNQIKTFFAEMKAQVNDLIRNSEKLVKKLKEEKKRWHAIDRWDSI
ncbi:MAG: hypothetical protein M1490_02930 [Candidatus Bathyarchaeota archaeon]|nr:hypothetical protein [Candidatus Bathyarchaeota archaeon]